MFENITISPDPNPFFDIFQCNFKEKKRQMRRCFVTVTVIKIFFKSSSEFIFDIKKLLEMEAY